MKPGNFPKEIQEIPCRIIPIRSNSMAYYCLGCGNKYDIQNLLYTCPDCGQILLIEDTNPRRHENITGEEWKKIFDYRRMLNIPALKGIFRYYELIAPVIPLEYIIYLGEGHTPVIMANEFLREWAGVDFYFKNDGQNPSASFKDRGMACALSYLNWLINDFGLTDVLAVCASTGDTSASAALYASYLYPHVKSAVILPYKKVTPQQLSQPLGSGASVFEIPGVFDDCMKVVEYLSEHYNVALLNSKNPWRILGQESYAYEVAQDFNYEMGGRVIFVPIGNAGNITAIMSGFLKLYHFGIIDVLPKIIGVQSEHANPVYQYYLESNPKKREFKPVTVKPSVAQAAMIGNPVSMPRVIRLAKAYNETSGHQAVFVVQVNEQAIMDSQLRVNRLGHIACTQGGECFAGLLKAKEDGIIDPNEVAILDSTAHAIKFSGFQEKYFTNSLDPGFNITPNAELGNKPSLIRASSIKHFPEQGKPLPDDQLEIFVKATAGEIAQRLELQTK